METISTVPEATSQAPALPAELAALAAVLAKRMPPQADPAFTADQQTSTEVDEVAPSVPLITWQELFDRAVNAARARGANDERLLRIWPRLSDWLLHGHKHSAIDCAYKPEERDIVAWALNLHMFGLPPGVTEHQLAQCADKARSYGAAGVFCMSARNAAVATAYASVVAIRNPSFIETTLMNASTAMYCRLWWNNPQADRQFWQATSDKIFDLIGNA